MSQQIATTAGTFTNPAVEATVSDGGGGVSYGPSGGTNMDSRDGLSRDFNMFQELNDFIRLCATNLGQAGPAVIVQLEMMLADMRRNPNTRPPVYTP